MTRKLKLGLLLLGAVGCRGTSTTIGAYETSLLIQADVGGTLLVDISDDPQLAGASITIPPGALTVDTTITLSSTNETVALVGSQSAGPGIVFGPSGTVFRDPVTISLPFALPAGATEPQLFAAGIDGNGNHEVFQSSGMVIDSTGAVVGFEILALGTFEAVVGPICTSPQTCSTVVDEACLDATCTGEISGRVNLGCGVDGNCLTGETCDGGICEGGLDGGGPATCMTSADCPQTPTSEGCLDGVCEPE